MDILPLLTTLVLAAPAPDLVTQAEKTQFRTTGRYPEVERLCRAFSQAHPRAAKCITWGTSPELREMKALVVSRSGVLDPAQARARGLPVVMFQGGIHAGEIDGKDAGFWLLREMLEGKAGAGVLEKVVAVFVPVFNVDGHERVGPHQRPNQVGPEEMGWRVTAQNLNLNRDYAKADAPEMQAMLALLHQWDPILYLDLHVTDGADFQPHVGVMMEPVFTGDEHLRALGKAVKDDVIGRLEKAGFIALPFYPSFNRDDDPQSGFAAGVAPPRFSTTYWGLQNRLSVLVETHSWKPYPVRVKVTRDTLLAFLELAARDGGTWLKQARMADNDAVKLGGTRLPIAYDDGEEVTTLDFPGYAYRREPSEISGTLRITYDPSKPQTWKIPFHPQPRVVATADVPRAGYVVPVAHAGWMAQKLALHGIAFSVVKKAQAAVPVEEFHVEKKEFRNVPYEGRLTVKVAGAWTPVRADIPAGSLWVPAAQARVRLLVHLLDPTAPDSFAAWGWFNAHMEQKEYMEPYVAESEARRMMAADPVLARAFNDKLVTDKAFASDPAARLDFFYRRHPSFDRRMDVLPVMRLQAVPAGW